MVAPSARARWFERDAVIEAAAYGGAAAAVAATFVALAEAGASETVAMLVSLAIAAVLLLAGLAVIGRGEPAYQRMHSVLWFGSVQAWSIAVQLFVTAIAKIEGRPGAVLSAALVTAAAAVLWWFLRRTLQQLALLGGVLGLVIALLIPEPGPFGVPDLTVTALAVWVVGLAWAVLGLADVIRPARTAVVLGAIVAIAAPLAFTDTRLIGELIALGTAAAALLVGERRADRAVGGIAIVGMIVVPAVIVVDRFRSIPEAYVALGVGVILLLGALVAARRPPRPAPPAAGSAEGSRPPTTVPPPPPTEH